eukprot:m.306625 g.306625  ORF g.306625 m.306625 type:complete len:294 (+) comp41419_c0_seq1:156-1037(+)
MRSSLATGTPETPGMSCTMLLTRNPSSTNELTSVYPKTILKTPSWPRFSVPSPPTVMLQSQSSSDNDSEEDEHPLPYTRSKSMGCRPLSPKKSVRFADTHGLALAQVFNIKDGNDSRSNSPKPTRTRCGGTSKGRLCKSLSLASQQPCTRTDFDEFLMKNSVCLENVAVRGLNVLGTVRVKNVDFEKRVTVRWSMDNWTSYLDAPARYVAGSSNDATDRFAFEIDVPASVEAGQKVQFAVRFVLPNRAGAEYWDNNRGKNYSLECYAQWKNGKKSDAWHDSAGPRGQVFGRAL